MYVCMYVYTPYFSWYKVFLWTLKINDFWTSTVSYCYHDPYDPGGFLYPCNSHNFGEKFVTTSSNNINHFFFIKVFIPKYFIVFPSVSCWLVKALGICAEGLWIRTDFLYEFML